MLKLVLLNLFLLLTCSQLCAQTCPGSEEIEANLSLKYHGEKRLFLCGFEDKLQKPPKGKKQFSNFSIYFEGETGASSKILSVRAVDNYWITLNQKKKLLDLEELVWAADQYIPIFKSKVKCGKEGCIKTADICAVPYGKMRNPDIVKQIDKKLRGKFTKISQSIGMMVQMALAEALAGNKTAIEFFSNKKILDQIEPSAVQELLVSQKVVERLVSAGCFGKINGSLKR